MQIILSAGKYGKPNQIYAGIQLTLDQPFVSRPKEGYEGFIKVVNDGANIRGGGDRKSVV